jgi:predicted alpha/beta hydrolase
VSDLQSSYQTNLNKVVQSGRITATQAKQMEQRYISSLPAMLTRKGLPTFHGGYRGNGNASGGASTSTSGANTTA